MLLVLKTGNCKATRCTALNLHEVYTEFHEVVTTLWWCS